MQSYLQRGKNGQQPVVWMRMIAALCILMITFMSAAQACHTHAEQSSLRQSSHHNQAPQEDHCPVCMAMHSALPATLHLAPAPTLEIEPLSAVVSDTSRAFNWRFEMASRGPPAADSNPSFI
jgi:hypothetical protein